MALSQAHCSFLSFQLQARERFEFKNIRGLWHTFWLAKQLASRPSLLSFSMPLLTLGLKFRSFSTTALFNLHGISQKPSQSEDVASLLGHHTRNITLREGGVSETAFTGTWVLLGGDWRTSVGYFEGKKHHLPYQHVVPSQVSIEYRSNRKLGRG